MEFLDLRPVSPTRYSEPLNIAMLLVLFLAFPWLCRHVDVTSAPIDPGALSAVIMAILSFLLFKAVTWRVMKAIWPVFTVYSECDFEYDFRGLASREKVLIYLGFYLLLLMGFVFTLMALL
jgi:hypothetical protein